MDIWSSVKPLEEPKTFQRCIFLVCGFVEDLRISQISIEILLYKLYKRLPQTPNPYTHTT